MDSQDFLRVVMPAPDRDATDAMLTRALLYVSKWAAPEQVFSGERLALWATQHGYAKADAVPALVALLREAQSHVPAYTPLATAMHDAIYAYQSA